jgi:hypothetical protein
VHVAVIGEKVNAYIVAARKPERKKETTCKKFLERKDNI